MSEQPEYTLIDLTIIIPVYNALPYFRKCIESITSQNTGQYSVEVILVDDGSTDGSGEYCDEAASQWNYIRAIHIENTGTPARPRNIGIEEANGNYIFFCDADDYFEENALALMLDHAYEDECDVGLFKMEGVNGRDVPQVYKSSKIWKHLTVKKYSSKSPRFLRAYGPWELYDRSLIESHNIKFPEKVAFEDLPFNIECYFHAKNICIYNDCVYYHFVSRDDGQNLTKENPSAYFWSNVEPQLSGLENYLSVTSRYCTPNNYPECYRRALVGPVKRILKKIQCTDEDFRNKVLIRLRTCFQPCKDSETLRQILNFANLILLDALFLCDDETFMKIFSSWPENANISFSARPEGNLDYIIRSDEDGRILLQASLPLKLSLEDQPIQNPEIFKNKVTSLQTTHNAIEMAGHVQILKHCEQGGFTSRFRAQFADENEGYQFDTAIKHSSFICVYASVYQIEFDWIAHCPFENLIPATIIDADNIHFFLDIEFDTGETASRRLGHNRVDGIYPNFVSRAVWCSGHLFAPYETDYNNLSCHVYSDIKFIKRASIRFLKQNNCWRLEAQGSTAFNNYASTEIEMAVFDTDDNEILTLPIEKGKDIKDRKFRGSFKLDDFDDKLREKMHRFELRIAVANKTSCYQVTDVKAIPTIENRLTHLQTSSEAIKLTGHGYFIRYSEERDFTPKLRAHFYDGEYDRLFEHIEFQNVSSENIYASVYQTEFDWSGSFLFEELIPNDNIDPSRIYLFLNIEFDAGEALSSRLGHNRIEETYSNFISQATYCENYVFAPYKTKYENFGLNAYSNIQLIRTTSLGFIKQDDYWHLEVLGALNFDNYAFTKIELAVFDTDGNEILTLPIEKGKDIKDRKFRGSFKLDDFDDKLGQGTYNFELRVAVSNKTFCYQNFEIDGESKRSIERNGKRDLLYATNEDILYFAMQQRVPLKQKIAHR